MKKIKKRFVESSFYNVLNIIKKNHSIYLYTIILDFIFLALIVIIGKYLGSLIPKDTQQLMNLLKTQANLLLFVIAYPVIYYLFVIFIYSAAKLSILNLIKPLYEKHRFTLKGFGKFYLLNLIIFIIFLLAALIILGILALILEKSFLKYIVLILSAPFLFFFYSIINIAHILFIQNKKSKIIAKSFSIAFSKITNYGSFIIWNIALIIIYLIFYNIIHLILRYTLFLNQQILINYGPLYLKIFNIISIIVVYLLIAFNRIYFYQKIEKIDKNVLQ